MSSVEDFATAATSVSPNILSVMWPCEKMRDKNGTSEVSILFEADDSCSDEKMLEHLGSTIRHLQHLYRLSFTISPCSFCLPMSSADHAGAAHRKR
jgi:hypothetical protein